MDGDNGGCHGTCTNTVGGKTCSCSSGYTLTNGNECPGMLTVIILNLNDCNVDKNECLVSNGGCAQNCHNTIGSFTCSCNAGYALSSNGKGCNGKCTIFK